MRSILSFLEAVDPYSELHPTDDPDYEPELPEERLDSQDLVNFAKAYNELGWAVQEQFDAILDGRFEDVNVNAFEVIKERMSGFHSEIDGQIEMFQETLDEEPYEVEGGEEELPPGRVSSGRHSER